MNITIVGVGNIGTQFAVHCAEKGHNVITFGSSPNKIKKELAIVNENNEIIHKGTINFSTDEPKKAFENSDLIFVTMPAFCLEDISLKIEPFARSGMIICIIPGTGGGECAFKKCADKGATICGLQRVPSVARLVKYGETVKATGYRKELFAASLPNCESEKCCMIISSIFNMKCYPMPCYLNLTLTPSNPILHTVRLRNLFDDYKEGKFYSSVPLFYEGWNDETSKMIFNCDDEVQNICSKLDKFDLSFVKSLKVHYESGTPEALTNKIQNILGFKGLKSPTKETPFGYIPDFESRYFTADFPFGLSILIQIADIVGVNVPYMRDTMNWYRSVIQNYKEFSYKRYGISSYEDFINFYSL